MCNYDKFPCVLAKAKEKKRKHGSAPELALKPNSQKRQNHILLDLPLRRTCSTILLMAIEALTESSLVSFFSAIPPLFRRFYSINFK